MKRLLAVNADGRKPSREPGAGVARILLQRLQAVPFFAHSYPFIRNMDHGCFTPRNLAEFAFVNGLAGLCLHVNDGGASSLSKSSDAELAAYAELVHRLGLALHLEISSTARDEIDRAVALALKLGVCNIRLYARRQGPLDRVMEEVRADLRHAAELANRRDLFIDYEQHEDLKSAEIAELLTSIDDPRLGALFDYTNSWNAHEEPLEALSILAPWVRQVHIKGGRKTIDDDGWGQLGVEQGTSADELPAALLLYELLLLGQDKPQVTAFALENEVGYYAPPFRRAGEPQNPTIAYREPSETPLDRSVPLEKLLLDEKRWAQNQVTFNRELATDLSRAAAAILDEDQGR